MPDQLPLRTFQRALQYQEFHYRRLLLTLLDLFICQRRWVINLGKLSFWKLEAFGDYQKCQLPMSIKPVQ